MKTKSILGLAAVVLAFALGGREAAADHVFQLVDVMFESDIGGTATGTFTTNDALTTLVTYDITTSTADSFPGFEYTPATAPGVMNNLPGGFVLINNSSPDHVLHLNFTGGLTATGATSVGGREVFDDFSRDITSGSVVGVPEPSALVLGGLAAAAVLGLWAWRRRAALRDPGGDR
jgi:MYXO-CTERM domain-containing protein